MFRFTLTAVLAVSISGALIGCASDGYASDEKSIPAPRLSDPDLDAAVMDRLGSLAGEWEMQDESGDWNTSSVFALSSNGSVVREIMFPGSQSEMTNLYHMDGTDIVATHYCAIGNQPRMVASGLETTEDGPAIDFEFDSVSNLRESQSHVMGSLRLVFMGDNTLREVWTSMTPDGEVDSVMTFDYRRKP